MRLLAAASPTSAQRSQPAVPVVYTGPSLPRAAAAAALPASDVKPPIRRGDLYASRQAGGTVFVIIDGVFFQEEAVSPREIIDVLEDGALIIGAASMGAMRAAECWPLGMRGVGVIYRLFRRGVLESDDEVAMLVDPDVGYHALSVALINVRYAAAQAVRGRRLDRSTGDRIVAAAADLFYQERVWRVILERAGVHDPDGQLEIFLARFDLKRDDALRALRTVARWLSADPGLCERPRRRPGPFASLAQTRERPHDALAGVAPSVLQRELARWYLCSGRYVRHIVNIAIVSQGVELLARLEQAIPRTALLLMGWQRQGYVGCEGRGGQPDAGVRSPLAGPAALRIALAELWRECIAREDDFAQALWAELALARELDAELFRWYAIRQAAAVSRGLGLGIRPRERYLAESAMLAAHGFNGWAELRQAAETTAYPWRCFVEYRDELALALRLRERLFTPPGDNSQRKE
jgi:hypothetical protein